MIGPPTKEVHYSVDELYRYGLWNREEEMEMWKEGEIVNVNVVL
jgi:hypothetical protein